MSLKFKKWIDAGHFSTDVKHLLDSSVLCYKSEAYTASLLMGYLGFLIVLKERLMAASKPVPFPDTVWNPMMRNLQNEDKWEETLLNALMTQEVKDSAGLVIKKAIFVINDSLRTQIKFWKDRRNDCVHHKDNAISGAHVEALWSFMEYNLQKITIEGGKATLINKFIRHYDSTYTPADTDVTPLLKQIKGSVEKLEMPDFWEQIFSIMANIFDYRQEAGVIKTIIGFNDAVLQESLFAFLKLHSGLLDGIIEEFPELLGYLEYDHEEIRNFWKSRLPSMRHKSMAVFAFMLRNDLIPKPEVNDAMKHMVKYLIYNDNVDDHYTLTVNGYGEILYNRLFVENTTGQLKYWEFMNSNYSLYVKYIKLYPLKDEVVGILCEELAKTVWNPKFLQQALNAFFKEDLNKKNEFVAKATALGFELPAPITELFV